MSRRLAVVLLPLVLLVAGCGDDDDDDGADGDDATEEPAGGDDDGGPVVYGEADDGTNVQHAVGDTFDVAVPQCVDCGYEWRVVTEPDEATVVLAGERDDGELHVFSWEVIGTGVSTLSVGYFPPEDPDAEKRITITVEVT